MRRCPHFFFAAGAGYRWREPVMELAEIMFSFGRREAPMQTLQEYIEANRKEALHPWVKLLEIYREGGMRSGSTNWRGN